MKRRNGFTLIELIITLAIVSIISSIAVPSYTHYVAKAKLTNLVVEVSQVQTALKDYIMHYGTFGRHYQNHSSVNMDHLGDDIGQIKSIIDADPNFHLIKIWLGRCNLPGITALISPDVGEPHNKPLITGGATQYVIRYDLEGTFVGISPAKWGGHIDGAKWWPLEGFYPYQELEGKTQQSNGSWERLCATP